MLYCEYSYFYFNTFKFLNTSSLIQLFKIIFLFLVNNATLLSTLLGNIFVNISIPSTRDHFRIAVLAIP